MKKNLLRWKALGSTLLVALALCLTQVAVAQNASVTGTVVDADNQEPIIGALVKVVGANTTTTATDINGQFVVQAPSNATLEVNFLGYKTQPIAVSGRSALGTILLAPDAQQLETVIITGYGGTTNRAKSTASIATVPKKVFEVGAYANPSAALSGAVPGLQVRTTSGKPGSVSTITLRGGTSLSGDGSPLIMVDGQIRGSLSDINPEDIGDMQVLKDAAATAIYGARANNGVILITSKRGKEGRAQISASAKVGLNYINNTDWKMMDAGEFLTWGRKGIMNTMQYDDNNIAKLTAAGNPLGTGNDWKLNGNYFAGGVWSTQFLTDENKHLLTGGGVEKWSSVKDPYTGKDLIFTDNPYYEMGFNNPSMTQDYNVSISGGNDKGSYYSSVGYYDEQAQTIDNGYSRLSFLFNGDYKITKWLKSESSFKWENARWRDWMHTSEGNYWARMYAVPPTVRLYNNEGEAMLGPNVGDGVPGFNASKNIQNYNTDRFTFSQGLTFQILPNLSVKGTALIMYDESFKETFAKDQRSGYLSATNPNSGWNKSRTSKAEFDRYIRQTYNAILQYKENFGGSKHNLDLLAGMEYYDQRRVGFSAEGKGAPTDDFMDLGLTSAKEGERKIDSWHDQYRIMSFLGRLNYDYDGKYIVGFTFREDGYSTLLGNNRWGFFPGISAAWVLTRENWMEPTRDWLSFLKIRASYGQNGNVSGIGSYDLQGMYGKYEYNNQVGFSVNYPKYPDNNVKSGLPSPGIRWEKSGTFEVGVDAGLFDGKLNVGLAYYNRVTEDLIADVTIPISQGFPSLRTNNGSIQNQGIEFTVGATPIRNKDWEWSINANLTWNKNLVVKLPNNGLENNRQNGTQIWDPNKNELVWVTGQQEGAWLGDQVVGYIADGIISNDADLASVANKVYQPVRSEVGGNTPGKGTAGAIRFQNLDGKFDVTKYHPLAKGDVMFRDIDGNDTVDTRDRAVLGKTTPTIFGGLSTTLTWKGLSLYIRTDFALDFVQIDWFRTWLLGGMQGQYNGLKETITNTWTPENPTAKYPLYYNSDQAYKNNYRYSSLLLYQGDYLCLREVALTYNFPSALIKKAAMQNLSLSVSAQNIAYLTASKNISKEAGGIVQGSYALPLTVMFGLKVTF